MHQTVLALLALLSLAHPAPGQECGMSRAFMQPDRNAPSGTTPVWSDAGNTALFFIESLNVNTDGTRRSYNVDDFWGKRTSLNNLCNAMSDACAGLNTNGLRNRRIITERAFAQGWPPALLSQARISSNIIPFKSGKPCPPVDGFLVSATALQKPSVTDVCDITRYVDSLQVAALVLPGNPNNGLSGFAARGARVGDLVVTMLPDGSAPVFAVVGDTGPARELGEGSVSLNGRLLGKTSDPINYDEVRGRGEFAGRGWQVPRARALVFPNTRNAQNPYMTTERIDADAMRRFEDWGGVARLKACAAAYEAR